MSHKLPGETKSVLGLTRRDGRNHRLPDLDGSAVRPEGDNAGIGHASLKWCTIECEHAEWPDDNIDGSKSCRTFSALWCRILKEHVTKNTPCAVEHGQRRPKPDW